MQTYFKLVLLRDSENAQQFEAESNKQYYVVEFDDEHYDGITANFSESELTACDVELVCIVGMHLFNVENVQVYKHNSNGTYWINEADMEKALGAE